MMQQCIKGSKTMNRSIKAAKAAAPMLAYHGDAAFRRKFLAEIRKHEKADQIVRGTYGNGTGDEWRGCAVGCSLHSVNRISGKMPGYRTNAHARYPEELEIPVELAHLEDRLFESVPIDLAKGWPLRFSSAIRAGADLSLVWSRFSLWLLVDPANGVIRFAKTDRSSEAIRGVAALLERQISGGTVTRTEWSEARNAAADAGAAAAYAAADAAADAGAAAAYAAADAGAAAAYAAAREEAFARQANKLVQLLKAAPVVRNCAKRAS